LHLDCPGERAVFSPPDRDSPAPELPKKASSIQKALILLHFRNPERRNKVLASRHPNMG
jgi:hypothetical protein